MFPLGMVVFPYQQVGLYVFEGRYRRMLDDVQSEGRFGTCLIARGSEVGGGDQRLSIGTVLEIVATHQLGADQTLLLVEGVTCCEVSTWLDDDPYPRALISNRPCLDGAIDQTLLKSTESAVRALRTLQSEINPDECIRTNCAMDTNDKIRIWQLCAMTPMSTLDQFKVLSVRDPNERLALLGEICCERYGDYQRMLAVDSHQAN